MKRRSRARSDPGKARRRKTVAPKRASASKAVPRRSSSAGDMEAKIGRSPSRTRGWSNELRQRTTGLSEALEQQKAASEVLEVISGSPGDLQPMFASMLENASPHLRRQVWKYLPLGRGSPSHRGDTKTPPAFAEDRRGSPYRPYPQSPIGRMVIDKTVAHISDLTAEEVYLTHNDPVAVSAVALGGTRTLLGVPLLNKDEMIGAFLVAPGSASLYRETNRAGKEFCGTGGGRHREHSAAKRTAPAHNRPHRAHHRPHRSVGAADCHV